MGSYVITKDPVCMCPHPGTDANIPPTSSTTSWHCYDALPAFCGGMNSISERQQTTTYAHALTQQVKIHQRMTYKI